MLFPGDQEQARVPVPTTLSQYSIGSKGIRQEKETNSIQIARDEIKVSLFVDNIILYAVNP